MNVEGRDDGKKMRDGYRKKKIIFQHDGPLSW